MAKLNENQLEAVNFEFGSLLVVAGAGTGKTSLITERIVHLINERKFEPQNILAVTFTEKAAREMVERLDEKMPLSYYEPKICTYHSFCMDVLKEDGHEMGMNTNFKLITDAEQWMLLRKEIYKLNLKELRPKNNPGKYINDLLKLFSKCTDENISSKDLMKYSLSLEDETEKNKWQEAAIIFDHYKEIKLKDSKMDFGDLITFVYDLFKAKPYVLEKYQKRFHHVLVDEFQDTNYTQYEIIKLLCANETLAQRSLVVVGDDSQSIYKFRGAAISNILEFKKDFDDPKIITLNQNYRSVQNILDVSYKVIQNNNPYTLEHTLGISKKLIANKKSTKEENIKIISTPDLETEVNYVVNEIQKLLETGEVGFRDIAILGRANSHLEPFIMALRKAGLPYQFYGNRGLYEREEIDLVICLLNLLINTSDSSNLFKCLFIDSLNIDVDTIYKLLNLSRDKKTLLWNECENYKFDKNLTKFVNTIKEYQRKLPKIQPSDLIYNLLNEINYLNKFFAEETIENDLSVKNLDLFLKRVKNIELSMFQDNGVTPNLLEFLDYFNLIIEAGDNPAQAEVEDVDTINILTVHSSKGLEFEAVFIPSLINGRFPTQDRSYGFSLPDELIEDKEILPSEDYFLQEERRLFYVGVTRAKKYLHLTFADTYGKRDRSKSTFVEECGLEITRVESSTEGKKEEIEQASLFGVESEYRKKINKIDSEYLPKSLSFTALTSYKTCPLKYKYQYILNFPTKQSKALSFGNTIHEVLKEYHVTRLNRDISLNEVLEIYKMKFQPFGYEDRDNQIDYYKTGQELLTKYYEKYHHQKLKPVVIEKMFKFELNGVPVSGKIDRIDLNEDGTYEIIDYKTGETKTEKEIRNDDQLTLYAEAAKEFFNYQNVKLTYFYLEKDEKISTERNEKDFERLNAEVKEVFTEIKNKNFKAKPSQRNCMFCDFKDICPSAIKD